MKRMKIPLIPLFLRGRCTSFDFQLKCFNSNKRVVWKTPLNTAKKEGVQHNEATGDVMPEEFSLDALLAG
jgi:predicted N-acyltransferase